MRTPYFGLMALPENPSNDELRAFMTENPILIDRILFAAFNNHRHDGAPIASEDAPGDSLMTLATVPGAGYLPAARTMWYRWTHVTAAGAESVASEPVTITTPGGLAVPGSPINPDTGDPGTARLPDGGSCGPGPWQYRLTAWRSSFTIETTGGPTVLANLAASDGDNQRVVFRFPPLPEDADGFNIYRCMPGDTRFRFVTTMVAATWPTEEIEETLVFEPFIDDGSPGELDRLLTTADLSADLSRTTIDLPVTELGVGEAYRVYRTYNDGIWRNTLIGEITAETDTVTIGEGEEAVDYYRLSDIDPGADEGTPPTRGFAINNPGPVSIPTETVGDLPLVRTSGLLAAEKVQAFLTSYRFNSTGVPALGEVDRQWVCPYQRARIQAVTASLAESNDLTGDLTVWVWANNGVDGWVAVKQIVVPGGDNLIHADLETGEILELLQGHRLKATVEGVDVDEEAEDLTVEVVMYALHAVPEFIWNP